ncbi:hypothetical protein [Caballeronia sp. INDeC2]|uniref:hypothetical protein n=1 Tax=Caballeronia sp. INDeC2 TaxID=2921747 RepID=UPI002028068D|nr:hypothetical protein [Caballeronia sp. INDeC2]
MSKFAGAISDNGELAGLGSRAMRDVATRVAALIRVDEIWLAVDRLDMRAGLHTALARVVTAFGAAHPHHAYLLPTAAPTA